MMRKIHAGIPSGVTVSLLDVEVRLIANFDHLEEDGRFATLFQDVTSVVLDVKVIVFQSEI